MFSKYSDISKMIRFYIDSALSKSTLDISAIKENVSNTFSYLISDNDLALLKDTYDKAKEARKGKDLESIALMEGKVRDFAYLIATKACIELYQGPLNLDTMRHLKEHGYDGTYGDTTMIQMYALYNQNEEYREKIRNLEASLSKEKNLSEEFREAYRTQYTKIASLETELQKQEFEKRVLSKTNDALEGHLKEELLALKSLEDNIPAKVEEILSNYLSDEKKLDY